MTLAQPKPLEDFRPPPWPQDFGRRLERLKLLSGLTWQELAKKLGVTDRAILLWRRGKRRPSGANLLAIMELARSIPGGVEAMGCGDAGAWE